MWLDYHKRYEENSLLFLKTSMMCGFGVVTFEVILLLFFVDSHVKQLILWDK